MEAVVHRMNRHFRSALLVSAILLLLPACIRQEATVPTSPVQAPAEEQILDAEEISTAQRHLAALGYDVGPADGILGPRSVSAIRTFQRDHHTEEDGKLTRALYARLEAARAKFPRDTWLRYEVGEIFIYSDGSSEAVEDVAHGARVIVDGRRRETKRNNFLILASAGERTDAPDDFLQPLRSGSRGEYRIYRRATDGQGEVASTVTCSVGGTHPRSVPAGKFPTIDASCAETTGATPDMERKWAYAPTLHHVVRDVTKRGGKVVSVRELVAIQPGTGAWPMAARSGFDWAIVNALRNAGKERAAVAWASTGVDERFSIHVDPTPVKSSIRMSGANGAELCLRYKLVRTDPAANGKMYPGIACKYGDGEWRIPARRRFAFESPPKGL